MKKRTEEISLKPSVTIEIDSAATVPLAKKTKRQVGARRGQRIERKKFQRSHATGGTLVAEPASNEIPRNEAIHGLGLVETVTVGEGPAPLVVAEPINPSETVESRELDSIQQIDAGVDFEIHPAAEVLPADRVLDCSPRILLADNGANESEEKQLGPVVMQTEVTPEVEVHPATELQRPTILRWLSGAWNWARKHINTRHPRKRLRVCESVSLGEKRFVAVIEVDGEQFLVGGASSSVATLARLEPSQEFAAVLKRRWGQDPIQTP